MSCNLEKALVKVNKLLATNVIKTKMFAEIKRIQFEIEAMMAAKDKMLRGPEVLPYDSKLKETSKKATPEFDALPEYVPGQKNMTYAGIGSRETPIEVLELMTKASTWLGSKGYTLQSGGAIGADMAFEGKPYPRVLTAGSYDVVNKKGKVVLKANETVKIGSEKYADAYYAFTDKATKGSIVGSDWSNKVNIPKVASFSAFDVTNNKFGNSSKVLNIAKELHTNPEKLTKWSEALMARNTYQVFGSNLDTPVDFVLFYAKEGKGIRPDGGTGQAVEMARLKGIPTVNMADKDWRVKLQEVLNNKKLSNEKTVIDTKVKSLKETTYEVSSKGDKDYSALYAKLEDGRSIEEHYQVDVKGYKTWRDGKGKPPKDKSKNLQEEYTKLWKRYFDINPDKYEFIKEKVNNGVKLTDQFATKNGVNQADTIMQIVNSKWEPKKRVDTEDKTTKITATPSENLDTPTNNKLDDKDKNVKGSPIKDKKIEKSEVGKGDIAIAPNSLSGYKISETELALDEYLATHSTPEASTKSEDSIINVEKVGKQSTKEKLNLLLKAYDSASGITIGGGYVENMQVKDGYRVSDMDEDVKKGTIEKGMYQESVADLLPKLDKRVSTYLKSYDKYYNEFNRTAGVKRDIEYLLDILNKVSSEPYVADAIGINVEEDVLIQEDTPINELIKDGIHCKNKG